MKANLFGCLSFICLAAMACIGFSEPPRQSVVKHQNKITLTSPSGEHSITLEVCDSGPGLQISGIGEVTQLRIVAPDKKHSASILARDDMAGLWVAGGNGGECATLISGDSLGTYVGVHGVNKDGVVSGPCDVAISTGGDGGSIQIVDRNGGPKVSHFSSSNLGKLLNTKAIIPSESER